MDLRRSGVLVVNLGGGAGLIESADDGLARFKRGWSNDRRTAYLCGRILDRRKYRELASRKAPNGSSFFPAYRAPPQVEEL